MLISDPGDSVARMAKAHLPSFDKKTIIQTSRHFLSHKHTHSLQPMLCIYRWKVSKRKIYIHKHPHFKSTHSSAGRTRTHNGQEPTRLHKSDSLSNINSMHRKNKDAAVVCAEIERISTLQRQRSLSLTPADSFTRKQLTFTLIILLLKLLRTTIKSSASAGESVPSWLPEEKKLSQPIRKPTEGHTKRNFWQALIGYL